MKRLRKVAIPITESHIVDAAHMGLHGDIFAVNDYFDSRKVAFNWIECYGFKLEEDNKIVNIFPSRRLQNLLIKGKLVPGKYFYTMWEMN
jgi:hypothetical protein